MRGIFKISVFGSLSPPDLDLIGLGHGQAIGVKISPGDADMQLELGWQQVKGERIHVSCCLGGC